MYMIGWSILFYSILFYSILLFPALFATYALLLNIVDTFLYHQFASFVKLCMKKNNVCNRQNTEICSPIKITFITDYVS